MKSIDDILKESHALPSLPAIVIELQQCLDQDNAGTKLLSQKLARDQVLAAKTLRLANSPLYSMQCTVGTIQQAVAVLGFDSVRTMVTTAAIVNSFAEKQLPADFAFEKFWRHSLATGLCAKALARFFNIESDQAFIAGLLHDIGKLVLARTYPEKFMAAVRYSTTYNCSISKAEHDIFGFDHAAAGARLAKQWNFPASIQRAIEEHESPKTSQDRNCLVSVIHVADAVVINYGLANMNLEDIELQPFSNPVWGETNEDDEVLHGVATDTKTRINEVFNSLMAH